MAVFPRDSIVALGGSLSGTSGKASIEISLKPFSLPRIEVDTPIRLDGVDLPSTDLWALAGRSFSFPVNPEPGYIDGSIYIEGAHHPVDVTRIVFHASDENGVVAEVCARFVLSFEGLANYDLEEPYEDFDITLTTTIRKSDA